MHAMQLQIYPCNDSIMKHRVRLVTSIELLRSGYRGPAIRSSWQGRGPAENHVSNVSDRQHKQYMTLYRY